MARRPERDSGAAPPSLFARLARSPLAWRAALAASVLVLLAFGVVGLGR